MTNCMTCRHNDKKAKYCPVKKVHTDLGYVLNCVVWAPTDKAEMKRFRAENAKLRELVGCYDSALKRMCNQMQSFYSQSDSLPCDECVLGKGHSFDKCGIDELQEEARKLRIEIDE